MSDHEVRLQCLAAAMQLGAALGHETAEAQRIYSWVTAKNQMAGQIVGGALGGQIGGEYLKAQNLRG